jgi:hypothetical protein
MDPENLIFIQFLLIGALSGVAYSIWNYITSTTAGDFQFKRFAASVLFGAGIGVFGGYSASSLGLLPANVEWWAVMGALFMANQSILQYVNRAIDVIWLYYTGTKLGEIAWFFSSWVLQEVPALTDAELKLGTVGTPYYRKMSQSFRENMVSDQPIQIQQMILNCVDEAEARTTWRYAIQAGAWVYLIEYGVLTGAKHYFYWQSSIIAWKPISMVTLETIRKTGKFPEYSQLT